MNSPYLFDKKQLANLYLKQKLSTEAIAKLAGCNHVTILNYLKLFNIPRRSKLGVRKSVEISEGRLRKLYYGDKMTQKEIAEMLGHSRYGIQRRMKIYGIQSKSFYETHNVYPKYDFSGDLIEKAYLIGFRLGDLNVYKVRNLIQVRCSSTIQAQSDLIESLFKKYGNVHIWKAKRGTFEIVALLNSSFDFLLPKGDEVPMWIQKNDSIFLSFIAGYSDAEGSFFLRNPSKVARYKWGVFEIQTYDKNILYTISAFLGRKGINYKYYRSRLLGSIDKRGIRNNQDSWRISIAQKQSVWNFIRLIEKYHRHKKKVEDLNKVKENILARNNLPYCRRIIL